MAEKTYYHGTDASSIYSLAIKGFDLSASISHGRVHGNGVYLASKPETAGIWSGGAWDLGDPSQYAVKCYLQKGTKILWKDANYDKKVVRYLEKEFGKQISRSYEFWKHIPHNKRLTSRELTSLVSHLNSFRWSVRFIDKKVKNLSRFSNLLRQYGYDAIGDRTEEAWDSDDICVYNPSRVKILSIHRILVEWGEMGEPQNADYSHPLSLAEIEAISEKDLEDRRLDRAL